jgi:hypothetical protein
VMGEQETNNYGKANFNYLLPGKYTICATGQTGWKNSQPGVAEADYGTPCYPVSLNPGEMTTVWFGNQQRDDPTPDSQPTSPRAIAIVQDADVASDDSGYDGWQFVDDDLNHDERGPMIFLPLAFTRK